MPQLAGKEFGPGNPLIVAELGCNHNGQLYNALALIDRAADAGAGLIKFQCYTLNEILDLRGEGPVPDPWKAHARSMRELYVKARTPLSWFPALAAHCEQAGIGWFSSVFGAESLRNLEGLGCPAYKVAALDVEAMSKRDDLWTLEKPFVASSRGGRIPWADFTLYCPAGYPQDPREWSGHNLRDVDGGSYHGTNVEMARWIAEHTSILEVHVQLDGLPSTLDAHSSLTISQLRGLCRASV